VGLEYRSSRAPRIRYATAVGDAMALHARREDSATASLNGLRPTNVPACALKLQFGDRVASSPWLECWPTA